MKFFKIVKKPDPKKEEALRRDIEEGGGLEKGDLPAMLLSAFLIILPICLAVLLLFAALAFLFFGF